jgi:mannose-6-phosphate isomerase-like protein (cupin superfamily)
VSDVELNKMIDAPWGEHKVVHEQHGLRMKVLFVSPNQRTSLQKHRDRWEYLVVVSGSGKIYSGMLEREVKERHTVRVMSGMAHRITANSDGLVIAETQISTLPDGSFSEDDIFRIEDDYGRVPEEPK